MATSSERTKEKATEKAVEKPEAAQKKEPKNWHVALPYELIEKLKDSTDWGQRSFQWTFDEEQVRQVWEWQSKMTFEELFGHVFFGDGEEALRDDDVFRVQQIRETSQPQPQQFQSQDSYTKALVAADFSDSIFQLNHMLLVGCESQPKS